MVMGCGLGGYERRYYAFGMPDGSALFGLEVL
jgi:hypothetical protein